MADYLQMIHVELKIDTGMRGGTVKQLEKCLVSINFRTSFLLG